MEKLGIPSDVFIYESATNLVKACFHGSYNAGWWHDIKTGEPQIGQKNVPTLLMLIVSELGEAMEGHRKSLMDEHLPQFTSIEVELADAVIRIFDMAGGMHYNLPDAIVAKLDYNRNRADHKPENRAQQNGKAY